MTQFKSQKHFYYKLFSLVNKVKWLQVLQFITNNPIKQSLIYTELNVKTVLFLTIQLSIQFNSNWPIDKTLSGATTKGQSGPGSNGNEEGLRIP